MNAMKWILVPVLLALPAAADEVILRNGSVFSGVVREDGERVTIHMDYGTMSFRRIDVREIRRSEDPLKELDARMLKASTAQDFYELSLWARDKGLPGRADELLKKVLLLEPGHEAARRGLGYELHEGRWLKGDDLMTARGLVKHGGRWITREAQQQLLAQESAESIEVERQKTIRQAAEMNREIELQKIELERERIQMELEKARRERHGHVHVGWGPYPCCVRSPVLWPSFSLTPGPGQSSGAHPGPGPGRTLPPVPERLYPGGLPSSTPPPPPSRRSSP